jgi:hypothetical protein
VANSMFLRNQPKNIHVEQIKVNAINELGWTVLLIRFNFLDNVDFLQA